MADPLIVSSALLTIVCKTLLEVFESAISANRYKDQCKELANKLEKIQPIVTKLGQFAGNTNLPVECIEWLHKFQRIMERANDLILYCSGESRRDKTFKGMLKFWRRKKLPSLLTKMSNQIDEVNAECPLIVLLAIISTNHAIHSTDSAVLSTNVGNFLGFSEQATSSLIVGIEQPHLLAVEASTCVGEPVFVDSDQEFLEFGAAECSLSGLDCHDSSSCAEGNVAAMEKLNLYLRLGEDCVGAVQRISSHNFNNEQCVYLVDKLQRVVQSASLFLNELQGDHGLPMDVAKVVEVFKFMLALAKQVKSFVQGCCKDSWVQSAMTLTNFREYVAFEGFNLELCRIAFCQSQSRCLTLKEVVEIHKVEVEVVKEKVIFDMNALSQKILLEGPSLSDESKDLASYLLDKLCEDNTGYDGGRLFEWVKPNGQLGRGASGTVDNAMWLGIPVAKKTFHGKENPDFIKEVEALSPLSHPNVMSLFCSGKNDRGCCSIIMELMDEDLQKLMERRLEEKNSPLDDNCPSPFPILEAVDIMLQIGEGGKYLHDQGILHRDLKSMNILAKNLSGEDLDGYVHVKVADFGLSKTKEKSTRYSTMSYNVGTSRWMAPEIIRFYESDEGSSSSFEGPKLPFKRDIYSFGMVCYEILTGDVPFSSIHNEREVKRQVIQGKRPELPKDPQKCPPPLKELIESCWSPNPQERPTFTAICSALKYLKYLLMRSCQTIKKI